MEVENEDVQLEGCVSGYDKISLRRLFLLSISVVGSLLILIALFVLSSLGLIGSALLVVQGLPSLTKNLADLACNSTRQFRTIKLVWIQSSVPKLMPGFSSRTFSRCSLAKNM